MKKITKYVAYDKTEFTERAKCLQYENRCRTADRVIARLEPVPDTCHFSNGHGYVQQKWDVFFDVKAALLKLANEECPHKFFKSSSQEAHPSWAHRIISECCNSRLDCAWRRIMNIDSRWREWGQPYYTANPHEAPEIKCLNHAQT